MNENEARVLATLAPGGSLTAAQIAKDAGISSRAADRAIKHLAKIGMVFTRPGIRRDAWEITPRGRGFTKTPRGRAYLDVPAGV
ncbi:helix-turn-helix domain-containing protein [Nocardia otitidiscaviarum]|uniref:helix-turn-helix domain-containing protein n=1 Tax=Nocardia otitidiscaviarum TaxID=1823 RepID=UPI0004A743B6|nr:helix-turn-helix domain-containing protein [Nocardia otitidiscaviarum]